MKTLITTGILCIAMLCKIQSTAQYNTNAGKNRAYNEVEMEVPVLDEEGVEMTDDVGEVIMKKEVVKVEVDSDTYGNANGNEYDLAQDGAFEGNTVVILQLYNFSLTHVRNALAEKGFGVVSWNGAPSPEKLREDLKKASQLWVVSGISLTLTKEHAEVIEEFFDSGKGLYIWGDNDPCFADANFLLNHIFDTKMTGDTHGDNTVGISGETETGRAGIVDGHLISTGVVNMYEGITIATIHATQDFSPLVYGSADNLVAAVYEKDGKRAIVDGGFTRLYYKWNTAGTGRYVKNAAAWLVNYERFGEEVYSDINSDLEPEEEEKKEDEKDMGEIIIEDQIFIKNDQFDFNGIIKN